MPASGSGSDCDCDSSGGEAAAAAPRVCRLRGPLHPLDLVTAHMLVGFLHSSAGPRGAPPLGLAKQLLRLDDAVEDADLLAVRGAAGSH